MPISAIVRDFAFELVQRSMLARLRQRPSAKLLSLMAGIFLCLCGDSRAGCTCEPPSDRLLTHVHTESQCCCEREDFTHNSHFSFEITIDAFCRLLGPCHCDTDCDCHDVHLPSPRSSVPSRSLCETEPPTASTLHTFESRATPCVLPLFPSTDSCGFPHGALSRCIVISRLLL